MRDPLLVPACVFATGVGFARANWITGATAAGLAGFLVLLALGGKSASRGLVVGRSEPDQFRPHILAGKLDHLEQTL